MGIAQLVFVLTCPVLLLDYSLEVTASGSHDKARRFSERLELGGSGLRINTDLRSPLTPDKHLEFENSRIRYVERYPTTKNNYFGRVSRLVFEHYNTHSLNPDVSFPEWMVKGAHHFGIPEKNLADYIINKHLANLNFEHIMDDDPVYMAGNKLIYIGDLKRAASRISKSESGESESSSHSRTLRR